MPSTVSSQHKKLLQHMHQLGYPVKNWLTGELGGACHGFASMFIQACERGPTARADFIARWHKLMSIDNINAINDFPARNRIECRAFFDGIQLHQTPEKFNGVFGAELTQTDTTKIYQVTHEGSKQFDDIVAADCWVGVYDFSINDRQQAGLHGYLKSLFLLARHIQGSFSLMLTDESHTIPLHFDYDKQQWHVFDINQSYEIFDEDEDDDLEEFVIYMATAFTSQETIARIPQFGIVTIVYATTKNLDAACQARIEEYRAVPRFTACHPVNKMRSFKSRQMRYSVVHLAAINCAVDYINECGKKSINVNTKSKHGRTPAHLAVIRNSVATLEALIRAGADLEIPDNFDTSPIILALSYGRDGLISELIAKKLISIDLLCRSILAPKANGLNHLTDAVQHNRKIALRVLIKLACTHPRIAALFTAVKPKTGRNLLFNAVIHCDDKTLSLLINDAKVDPTQIDNNNQTLLHWLLDNSIRTNNPGREAACLRVLLQQGIDINAPDNKGRTALHIALANGQYKSAETLLNAGARIDIADMNGDTAANMALPTAMQSTASARVITLIDVKSFILDIQNYIAQRNQGHEYIDKHHLGIFSVIGSKLTNQFSKTEKIAAAHVLIDLLQGKPLNTPPNTRMIQAMENGNLGEILADIKATLPANVLQPLQVQQSSHHNRRGN